jgi:hypothetical protein
MHKKLLIPFLALVCACSEDEESKNVSISEVNTRAGAIVGRSARNVADAFVSLSNLNTWSSISAALDNLDLAFASVPSFAPTTGAADGGTGGEPIPPPPDQVEPPEPVEGDEGGEMDPAEVEQGIREALEQYIFNQANLESSDETSATFRLRGEVICPVEQHCTWDACDGTDPSCWDTENVCTEGQDQECIDGINQAEIRIIATPVGDDGIDLVLQIGPERASPLALQLRSNSITLDVDLAGAKSAVEHIASIAGETVDMPRVMVGKLRWSLTLNGEQDVTLAASVLEDVAIEVDGENGATSLDVLAADGFSMRVQGLLGRLSMDLDAGAVDVSLPYIDVTPNATGSGAFSIHVGGASFSVVLDEGQQSLALTNLGLGDSSLTIAHDATTLFSLDLNPSSGRRFDLSVVPSADSALFTVTPQFDLTEAFMLASIAADFPDIEPYFLDTTYRVTLAGEGSASVLPIPADELNGWYGGLQIVSGSLTLSAASNGSTSEVLVPTGECLTGTDTPPEGSHPVLGHFVVTACPQ